MQIEPGSEAQRYFPVIRKAGFFLIAAAVCFFVFAGLSYRRHVNFLDTAARTTGTVVDYSRRTSSSSGSRHGGGSMTIKPIFEYTHPTAGKQTVKSRIGELNPPWSVGDKVTVLYSTEDPARAEIERNARLPLTAILIGGLGLGALFFGGMAVKHT